MRAFFESVHWLMAFHRMQPEHHCGDLGAQCLFPPYHWLVVCIERRLRHCDCLKSDRLRFASFSLILPHHCHSLMHHGISSVFMRACLWGAVFCRTLPHTASYLKLLTPSGTTIWDENLLLLSVSSPSNPQCPKCPCLGDRAGVTCVRRDIRYALCRIRAGAQVASNRSK
jgi:hypothetical protein